MSALADAAHATTPLSRSSLMRSGVRPASPSSRSVSVPAGSAASATSIGPSGPPCRPAPGPPGGTASGFAVRLDDRLHDGAPGRVLLVVDQLVHGQHRRHAGVGPGQCVHPVVAGPGGEGRPEVRPDLVLGLVVQLVGDPLLAAEQPAEVGEELGLDGTDGQPSAVGGLVRVVAGVPAGDDVVPGPDRCPGGQVLVDGQRGDPEHAVGDGHVEMATGPSCPAPMSAAITARAACMPPPAASAMVAPETGGRRRPGARWWPGSPPRPGS